MPRPTDHYTHAQFQLVDSDFAGDTVRCIHCKEWNGSAKTLARKKEHLLKCAAYIAWRAAGHGQDLPPPNKYSKRDSAAMNDEDPQTSPFGDRTPNMTRDPRNRLPDLTRYFSEAWDEEGGQKCIRTRCEFCGFVRAKNSTRQYEHLQQCAAFLSSSEGQHAVANGIMTMQPAANGQSSAGHRTGDIFKGTAPNPGLGMKTKPRQSGGRGMLTPGRPGQTSRSAPSLVSFLLTKTRTSLEQSTQLQFLSHAGCATLAKEPLQQWLTQQSHMSRALCTFIGSLIGKIRLTDTLDPANDSSWRALDLLVSAMNNAKRELDFLRTTRIKYSLTHSQEPPKPAAKGMIDLFAGVTSPAASLLEGIVILWAVEHLYCISWQYAQSFVQAAPPSSTSYTVPSYLQPGQYDMQNPYGQAAASNNSDNAHTAALQEALIPNWTSLGFSKFVDACKSIVDELANAQTTGNGASELTNCEANFKQAVWLWKQMFPEVTGMGEEAEPDADTGGLSQANGNANQQEGLIEVSDDDDDESEHDNDADAPAADSPYAGTGLGMIAAANRAG